MVGYRVNVGVLESLQRTVYTLQNNGPDCGTPASLNHINKFELCVMNVHVHCMNGKTEKYIFLSIFVVFVVVAGAWLLFLG